MPLVDIDSTLKEHCHQLYISGTAKTNTVYFSSAKAMHSDVDLQASNRFMNMRTIKGKEVTNVLKLRTGNIYTNKLAFRYGHATSP
jgi:hypothetical protein